MKHGHVLEKTDSRSKIHDAGRGGFTLIELFFSVAILALVIGGVMLVLAKFRSGTDLNRASASSQALLRLAQTQAAAGKDNLQWGVHVTTSELDLFSGAAWGGTAKERAILPSGTTASAVLAGGGSDVVFNRLDGSTTTNGTITLTNSSGSTSSVTIFTSGDVSASSALPTQLGTRVTDTRHVHLDLPISLSSAALMTLTFTNPPNPPTVQIIIVPAQISNGQFFWEGDVDVNGSIQHLRLISHSIGVSSTNLSVQRDRIINNKAVDIAVDVVTMATYDASGAVTPGIGVTATPQ